MDFTFVPIRGSLVYLSGNGLGHVAYSLGELSSGSTCVTFGVNVVSLVIGCPLGPRSSGAAPGFSLSLTMGSLAFLPGVLASPLSGPVDPDATLGTILLPTPF